MKFSLLMFLSNIFYVEKKIKRTVWYNGLGKQDMWNLYSLSIGAISGSKYWYERRILAWNRYVGLVQVSRYHRLQGVDPKDVNGSSLAQLIFASGSYWISISQKRT